MLVLRGNGDGTFQAPGLVVSKVPQPRDVVIADLDADGRPDVALTELTEHALVLLEAEPRKLSRALGFKIFEDQAFGSSPDLREPREVLSADLTGDDKDDLAVLVHDKLIVYVQE